MPQQSYIVQSTPAPTPHNDEFEQLDMDELEKHLELDPQPKRAEPSQAQTPGSVAERFVPFEVQAAVADAKFAEQAGSLGAQLRGDGLKCDHRVPDDPPQADADGNDTSIDYLAICVHTNVSLEITTDWVGKDVGGSYRIKTVGGPDQGLAILRGAFGDLYWAKPQLTEDERDQLNHALQHAKNAEWEKLYELLFPTNTSECSLSTRVINSIPEGLEAGKPRTYGILHHLAHWGDKQEPDDNAGKVKLFEKTGKTTFEKTGRGVFHELCKRVEFDLSLLTPLGKTAQQIAAEQGFEDFARELRPTMEHRPENTGLGGTLSPLSECTVPDQYRADAGIPDGKEKFGGVIALQHAKYYCFIHPMPDIKAREKLRRSTTGLKLSRNPWAFVLLMGGYAYFDEDMNLISVNAITFTPSDSDEHPGLLLVGRELPSGHGEHMLKAMEDKKRLVDITEDSVRDAGFLSFGWVHADEKLAGKMLSEHNYSDGTFLYKRTLPTGVIRACMYALMTPAVDKYDQCKEVARQMGNAASSLARTETSPVLRGALTAAYRKSIGHSQSAKQLEQDTLHELARVKQELEDTKKQAVEWARRRASSKFWQQLSWHNPYIEAALMLLVYVGAGILFYSLYAHQDDGKSWTALESFYFAVVTMSTVGYGDLAPVTGIGRACTSVYILLGVAVVFSRLGWLYDQLMGFLKNGLKCCVPDTVLIWLTPDINTAEQFAAKKMREATEAQRDARKADDKEKERYIESLRDAEDDATSDTVYSWFYGTKFYLKKLLVPVVIGFVFNVIIAAAIFCAIDTDMLYSDAVWHCWVTATTVGYGDVISATSDANPASKEMLTFASIHIVSAVSWLASTVGLISSAINERAYEKQQHQNESQQLKPEIISALGRVVPYVLFKTSPAVSCCRDNNCILRFGFIH